jgi:hypothetical protein
MLTNTSQTDYPIPYVRPVTTEELRGHPATHLCLRPGDFDALVMFWAADEALIDSDVAYPRCPPGVDPDQCDHFEHQPLKAQSGEMLTVLAHAVLGTAVADNLWARMRANVGEDIVSSLLAIGVRRGEV